jgi:hypothetical protein
MGALQFPNSSDRLIDFVNPRKKVEQKKPIGSYILGAAAAAGLLGASWWWYSSSHAALDQDIQLLKDEIAGEATILKSSAKNLADWKKLETYLAGDVLWVDELERLSQNAKDSDTTYFGGTTFALEPRTNSPTIVTKFFTKEQDLVPEIQGSYRDEKHNVQGTGLAQSQDKKFRVVADMKITVANPQVKDPRNVTRKPIEEAKPKEPAIETVAEPAAEVQSLEPAESEAKTTPPDPSTQPPENKGQDPKSPSPPSASEQTPTEPTPTEPSKPATEPILGGAS